MAAALSIAATVTLISFLTAKELVSVRVAGSSQRMGRFLTVAIAPLAMVFVAVVAAAIAEVF